MEIDFWWLLALPLFFGLGWLAARIDIRQVVSESRSLPRAVLSGVNHLLNDQQDKAVDAFTEAARVDPNTVEVHFALGSLFRRRGETGRAIRMHQHLIEREDLSEAQTVEALAALGQDYLKAGLLDRAEAVFQQLREKEAYNEAATRYLLEIYQQEKEWQKAIDVAETLPESQSVHWRNEVANFHCELAAKALAQSRFDQAREHIKDALMVDRRAVRASVLLGDVLVAAGRDEEAIEAWKRIENQDPDYLSLVAERVMAAFNRLGAGAEGNQLLRAWQQQHSSLDLLEQVFRWVLEHEGPRPACLLVRDELRRNPTLLGLEKLLEAADYNAPPEQRADIELIKQLIHQHTRRVARYRCRDCGFQARQFQWRCPACGGWGTYPPRRNEEFDLEH